MKKITTYTALLIGVTSYAQLETISTEYEYDNLNRLVQVVSNGETTRSYTYDNLGNRLDNDTETDDGLTYVPDDAFEQALIDQGFDDVLDDYVVTDNIDDITNLIIDNLGIEDLTGIEDFESLVVLLVHLNELTTLDVSQNLELADLHCEDNNLENINLGANQNLVNIFCRNNVLTEIDLSQNTSLRVLDIINNQFEDIDVSQNLDLKQLQCSENQITELDLDKNIELEFLDFSFNQIQQVDLSENLNLVWIHANDNDLEEFNIKNDNNEILATFRAQNNPNLFCIQVDNENDANNGIGLYGNWVVDSQVSYSESCTLGIDEFTDNSDITISPNPTSGLVQIQFSDKLIGNDMKYDLIDSSGRKIAVGSLETNENISTIDLSKTPSGTYILVLYNQLDEWTKRIIKI